MSTGARIGIDVGGTKTHVVVAAGADTLLDRVVPTSAWQQGEITDSAENAGRLLALVEHVADPSDPLVVGAHGIDSEHQADLFSGWIADRRPGPFRVVNDVELLAAAAGHAPSICVIAGTGSKVVGWAADGTLLAAGGHGYLIDDPGSAPALVRDAVRAVVTALDAGEQEEALGVALRAEFDALSDADLSARFSAVVDDRRWGALAPVVFDCARSGSRLALDVITAAGAELAGQVATVHRRGAVAEQVVCAGGVIAGQPLLLEALESALGRLGLRLPVRLLTVPPVMGAVTLATRLALALP